MLHGGENQLMLGIYCIKCGTKLDSSYINEKSKENCPFCGAIGKSFKAKLSDEVGIHSCLFIKKYESGTKKPNLEIITGDSFYKKEKRWVHKSREIDRKKNKYYEEIKDKDGIIIHKCEEPLTDHYGLGSAKRRN